MANTQILEKMVLALEEKWIIKVDQELEEEPELQLQLKLQPITKNGAREEFNLELKFEVLVQEYWSWNYKGAANMKLDLELKLGARAARDESMIWNFSLRNLQQKPKLDLEVLIAQEKLKKKYHCVPYSWVGSTVSSRKLKKK